MKEYKVDRLTVRILDSREAMGEAAAKDIHDRILALLTEKETINMIFAAAPSQNEALSALVKYDDIDWSRINAFHMDEYIGLTDESKSFGRYLRDHIFGLVNFRSVNYIDFGAADHETECERYSKLLHDNPTDIVVMGIGENGHIAFNEPGSSLASRTREVRLMPETIRDNSRFFDNDLSKVPTRALTVGVGTVTDAREVMILINGSNKARALCKAVEGHITQMCPISALQLHSDSIIVCDDDAAVELQVKTFRFYKQEEKLAREGLAY